MKKIDYLIIVTTDTATGTPHSKADLIRHHTTSQKLGGLGLTRPRIDDMITTEGELVNIIPEQHISEIDLWNISLGENPLLGQAKYVAYVGGRTKDNSKPWDTRTDEQVKALITYVHYHILKHPQIKIIGLNQIPAYKGVDMPCFNVPRWLKKLGIAVNNKYTP